METILAFDIPSINDSTNISLIDCQDEKDMLLDVIIESEDNADFSPLTLQQTPSLRKAFTLQSVVNEQSCSSQQLMTYQKLILSPLAHESGDKLTLKTPNQHCTFSQKAKCIQIEAVDLIQLMRKHHGKDQVIQSIDSSLFEPCLDCAEDPSDLPQLTLIDCRWQYEFDAGTIQGAANWNDGKQLKDSFLLSDKPSKRQIVVFFCEYSQVRSLKLSNYFRAMEMLLHKKQWFQDIFLLRGGYNNFFQYFKEFTTTGQYVKEQDPSFENQRMEFSNNGNYFMNIPVEDGQYLFQKE